MESVIRGKVLLFNKFERVKCWIWNVNDRWDKMWAKYI